MPYIGNTIRAADDYRLIDDISSGFNGSETSFALQVAGSAPVPFPKSPQQVLISVNGVIQEPDPTGSSGFNLVGTNIVFSSAPTNGHAFFGIIYATADYLNAGGNFPAGSLGAPSITFIGDENTGLFRKSGGSVGFVSDATEIANFDSNGITISSGNLIIPDSIIHGGDTDTKIRFSSANRVSVETAGTEKLAILHDEIIINETGGDFDLRIESDNSTNIVRIDAGNDRVGINTSAPEEKLHVNGALVSTGSNQTASTSGSNRSIIDLTSGGTRIGHFRGTTSAGSGSLKFFVDSSQKMTIDASGNVGIGTASPAAQLEVKNTGNVKIYANSNGGYIQQDVSNLDVLHLISSGVIKYQSDPENDTVQTAHIFECDGSEKLRINASGNVGIGTTSPNELFHISGNSSGAISAKIENTFSSDAVRFAILELKSGVGAIRFHDQGDTLEGEIKYDSTSNSMHFHTNGSLERMRINSSGQVGIGVTSPAAKLHVSDSYTAPTGGLDSNNALVLSNTNAGNSVGFSMLSATNSVSFINFGDTDDGDIGGLAYFNTDNSMTFRTNTVERMRIKSDGTVGIGTTAPAYLLDVTNGSGNAKFNLGRSNSASANNAYGSIFFSNSSGTIMSSVRAHCESDNNNAYLAFTTTNSGSNAECARFNKMGRLFLNVTGNPTNNADGLINGETSSGMDGINIKHSHAGQCVNLWRANGDGALINFARGNSLQTGVGSVTVNANSTSYNTTSDYRLKENITTLSDGITRLKNLKPSRFNFIHDPDNTVDGFLAHEAMAVVPECGVGIKDEVVTQAMVDSGAYTSKKLGTPLYQGLDYGRITPLLTAALQEAIAKIETLETEVAALKAA